MLILVRTVLDPNSKVGVGLTSLNTMGATPFLLAARTADAELMRFLAKLGADPLIPTADNATPLIVAAGLGTRSPGEDAGTEDSGVQHVILTGPGDRRAGSLDAHLEFGEFGVPSFVKTQ